MASTTRIVHLLGLRSATRIAKIASLTRNLSTIVQRDFPTWRLTRAQLFHTSGLPNLSAITQNINLRPQDLDKHARSVFIGGLDPETAEENLEEYFAKFGEIENVRLMRTFLGYSRNYGFVLFKDQESANEALQQSNHVIDGKRIDLGKSRSFRSVYVGGLPSHIQEETLKEHFSKFGNVDAVKFIENPKAKVNTGCAFITYSTPEEAKKATELEKQEIQGCPIVVKVRSRESGEGVMAKAAHSKKLMVQELAFETTVEELRDYFEKFGELQGIDLLINSANKTCAALVFFRHLEDIQKVVQVEHCIGTAAVRVMQVIDQERQGIREKTVFVDNLPEDITKHEVLNYFRTYGQIAKVNLLMDEKTGRGKGCGVVKFRSPRTVERLLDTPYHVIGKSQVQVRRRGLKIRSHTDDLSLLNFNLSLSNKG